MGYMRHHAIVVTCCSARIEEAHDKAFRLCDSVSPIVSSVVNGYRSFLVATDGSKEGWDESAIGDAARAAFVSWLRSQAHSDGSNPFDWVEVQYGDDERETKIVASSDGDRLLADARARVDGSPEGAK